MIIASYLSIRLLPPQNRWVGTAIGLFIAYIILFDYSIHKSLLVAIGHALPN